jgi:gluconolactonase
MAPDGDVEAIEDELTQPNGIALSLDERTLFVGHAGGLVRYPLAADGSVTGPRVAIDAITGGVDGLGRDCAGHLYVTTGGAVVVLDPAGEERGRLGAPGATNVAFGGDDGRTLYVTSLGDPPALRAATLDVSGLPD